MQLPSPLGPNPSLPLPPSSPSIFSLALAADVQNSVAGSFVSIFTLPVGVGENWHFRAHLWIGNTPGVAGGIICRVNTIVTAASLRCHWFALGATSGTFAHQSQPPNQPAGTFVSYDAGATNVEGMVTCDCTAHGIITGGVLDLVFAPNTNGQNYIVRRGSYVDVFKV